MSLKSWFILKAIKGELPLWMYQPLGRKIKKELEAKMADLPGIQEKPENPQMPVKTDTPPNALESRPKWKSRTVWIAIITAVIGAVKPISEAFGHPVEVPQYVIEVLIGLGLYTARFPKQ